MANGPLEAPRRAARRLGRNSVASRRLQPAYAVEPLECRTLLSVPPVGPEFMVHPPGAGGETTWYFSRHVATDALGNSVAVWVSIQGPVGNSTFQIQGQRFDAAGVKQGPVFGVNAPDVVSVNNPEVAMDAAGGFVVVWSIPGGVLSPSGIFFRRFGPDASPAGPVTLAAPPSSARDPDPSVALDADGDFVLTFEMESGSVTNPLLNLAVQRYDATGVRKGEVHINPPGAGDALVEPDVAIDADGNHVVVWRRAGASTAKLEGRRFSADGVQQGADFEVTPFAASNALGPPQAAMDADGDFVVTWDDRTRDAGNFGVYARQFTRVAAPAGLDFLVNTTSEGYQHAPHVAMSAGGGFVVVWIGQGQGVVAQNFHASLGRIGGEFVLSSAASPGELSYPSVAMDHDGDFSAVWTSRAGGNSDVYARRFAHDDGVGTVQGRKVLDLNADGVIDPSEPGLGGWTIFNDVDNNGGRASGRTGGPGRAANVPLPPGETRRLLGPSLVQLDGTSMDGMSVDGIDVTINLQHPRAGDLVVTLISPAGRRAELFSNVGGSGANFAGTIFDDAAAVAIDAGAAPFSGKFRTEQRTLSVFNGEVFGDSGYWMLEVRNAGQQSGTAVGWSLGVNYSEPGAVTDPAGNYSLSLPAGIRAIAEVPRPAFVQTFPRTGPHTVLLHPRSTSAPLDFANAYAGVASGFVFDDVNANGVSDPGEGALSGWRIFNDANFNGQLDPTEPSTLSDATFGYSLRGLRLSDDILLGAIPRPTTGAPWELSAAPEMFEAVFINPGKYFGAFKRGSIYGVSFNDLNSNGVREPSEPPLAGTRVFLDQDGDGAYDDGRPASVAAADVPRSFDFRTVARSRLTLAGVSNLLDLDLTLNISVPDSGAITATLTSPDGETAVIFEDYDAASGDLVGITFDDEADVAFADAQPRFEGSYRPAGELRALMNGNPNGVWTLTVSGEGLDRFGGGVLAGWSLASTSPAEPFTLTGAGGGYVFAPLAPGRYRVGAVVPAPWVRTAPPGVHTVDVLSGQDAASFDFGQFDPTAPTPTRVVQVYVGGPQLMPGGNPQFLAAAGIGTLGYPVPAGAGQLRPLPWTGGIDRIAVRFDRDVSASLDASDLRVRGVARPSYQVLSFAWDGGTRTATWTITPAVFNDKLQIELHASSGGVQNLDGEWTNPPSLAGAGSAYPSGDGYAGGDFRFNVNVLAGDATGDGVVNVRDQDDVRRRLGRRSTNPAAGPTAYSVFADVNADGAVNALDVTAVRQRLAHNLPSGVIPAPAAALASLAARPSATRDLFPPRRGVFN